MADLPDEMADYLAENPRLTGVLFALLLAASSVGNALAAAGGTNHGP